MTVNDSYAGYEAQHAAEIAALKAELEQARAEILTLRNAAVNAAERVDVEREATEHHIKARLLLDFQCERATVACRRLRNALRAYHERMGAIEGRGYDNSGAANATKLLLGALDWLDDPPSGEK